MRIILIAALSAPALVLGGCSSTGGTINRGVESVKQPVVSRTDYVFDAQSRGNGLAPGEAVRVAGWMDSMKLRYGDHVSIDAANAAYAPTEAEIAQARKFIAGFEAAEAEGKGVVLVDGKLVENLHVANAKRLVALADRIAELGSAT